MSVAGAISSFFTGTYTVGRYGSGSYADGVFVPGSPTTLSIGASVQEARGRELERLPEGLNGKRLLVVYTKTALRTRQSGAQPDVIAIGGENYQVELVEDWSALGGYYKAVVAKEQA